jgi:hypothetical protein
VDDAAWEMMKSKEYQNAKCDYGAPYDTDFFSVAIPKLNKRYSNPHMGIINGEMRFRRFVLGRLIQVVEKTDKIIEMSCKLFLMCKSPSCFSLLTSNCKECNRSCPKSKW